MSVVKILHSSTTGFTPANAKASGSISFPANPTAGQNITLGGTVVTFGPVTGQVNIGSNLAGTMTTLGTFLAASNDANISKCSYITTPSTLVVTYDVGGTIGNAFTLAASNAIVSDTVLHGGGLVHGQIAINDADGLLFWLDIDGVTIRQYDIKNAVNSGVAAAISTAVNNAVTSLIGGAASGLNTLGKIATSINNNTNLWASIQGLITGVLHYDTAQTITPTQQATARTNIGAYASNGGVVSGDVTTQRPASLSTGFIFFGNSGGRYFGWDGAEFWANGSAYTNGNHVVNGSLFVNASETIAGNLQVNGSTNSSGNCSASNNVYAVNNIFSYVGYTAKQGINGGFGNIMNTFWDGGSVQMWVDATYVGSAAGTSDPRVKKNIAPLGDSLAVINQLKPITFNWQNIGVYKDDGKAHVGFSTDDVLPVIPDAVMGAPGQIDVGGSPVYKSINAVPILATLTKAVQELSAKVDALEARVGP